MQVWVGYDGAKKNIDVTLAPIVVYKPHIPLLSLKCDLSMVHNKIMYVGISSSTCSLLTSHCVLEWRPGTRNCSLTTSPDKLLGGIVVPRQP
ncbi:unnamed protein product [Malus baccata var. baccata]